MAIGLQQIQTQKTLLTPEQIQVIKMLEIPTAELQQRIDEELQDNPLLEIGEDTTHEDDAPEENNYSQDDDCSDVFGETTGEDPLQNEDFDYSQYTEDDEIPDSRLLTHNYSADDERDDAPIVSGREFHEYLLEQIGQQTLTDEQRKITEYIIGNIDERGYLTREPEQMVDDLAFHAGINVSDEEMKQLVERVRHLDPPGVGAYTLKDCLLMQLNRKPVTPARPLALNLVNKFLEEIGRHHFERLQKRLNVSEEAFKAAVSEIKSCNPTPSSAFATSIYDNRKAHIIPDFRVEIYNDEIIVSLCDSDIPPLRVSPEYQDILASMQERGRKKSAADKEGIRYIKQKMDSARWFIDAIRQRNETLLVTMQAIVAFQREYFLEGDDCFLKPMILEDIAQVTGYDPSTISRVSNSKYVLTDFGIIPLKHFFSESLSTDRGEEVSTREVKKVIREIIDAEDKRHPLRDEQLVDILNKEGYVVARRTIAKYRGQLNIPVAGQRKELKK